MTLMEWLQAATAGGSVGALSLAAAAYIRTRPAMKAEQLKGETALWVEINSLRAELKRERDDCDERIERAEQRSEKAMAEMKAEIRVLRHERNNTRQGWNALLTMLKRIEHPELRPIIEAVEEMVAKGDELIAVEKAAIPQAGTRL